MRLPLWAWSGAMTTLAVVIIASITLSVTWTITSDAVLAATSAHVEARLGATLYAVQDVIRRPIILAQMLVNASRAIAPTHRTWSNETAQHLVRLSADLIRVPWLGVTSVMWVTLNGSRFTGNVRSLEGSGMCSILENQLDAAPIRRSGYNLTSLTEIDDLSSPLFSSLFSLGTNESLSSSSLLQTLHVMTVSGTTSLWFGPSPFFAGYDSSGAPVIQYGISLDAPIRLCGGQLVGYVFPTMTFDAMSSILFNFVRTVPNGASFMVDAFGFLMASSLAETVGFINFTFVPLNTVARPLHGCDSIYAGRWGLAASGNTSQVEACRAHMSLYEYAPLNALAEAAPQFPFTDVLQSTNFVAEDSRRFFAAAQRVDVRYGNLNLFLIVMMPETELAGDVMASRNLAIGLCVAIVFALLFATAAGLVVMLRLLRRLADELTLENFDTKAFDVDGDEASASSVQLSELVPVSLSYKAMARELQRIRAFVPQSTTTTAGAHSPLAQEFAQDASVETSTDLHFLTRTTTTTPTTRSTSNKTKNPRITVNDEGNHLTMQHPNATGAESPSPQTPPLTRRYSKVYSPRAHSGLRPPSPPTDDTTNDGVFQRSARSVHFSPTERFAVGDVSITPQSLVCLYFGSAAAAVPGTHLSAGLATADAIERATRTAVDAMQAVASEFSGTLRPFLGDHAVIEFRHAEKSPLLTACAAAMRLRYASPLSSESNGGCGHWSVAVEAGLGMVGAVGSTAMSSMHLIGKNYEVYQLARAARLYRRRSVFLSARNFDRLSADLVLHAAAPETMTWGLRRVDYLDLLTPSGLGPQKMRPQHPCEIHALQQQRLPRGAEDDTNDDNRSAARQHPADGINTSVVLNLRNRLIMGLTDDVANLRDLELAKNSLLDAVSHDLSQLDRIDVLEYFYLTDVPALVHLAESGRLNRLSTDDTLRLVRRTVPRFPTTRELLSASYRGRQQVEQQSV